MEISAMVTDLKNKGIAISRDLRVKEDEANKLRDRLKILDAEIQELADSFDAMKMAIDALELMRPSSPPAFMAENPDPEPPKKEIANIHHSRKPRKIGKYDPKGKKIGEFASINKAARTFGWSTSSMTNYIENTPRDNQVKIRGYYLDFIVA